MTQEDLFRFLNLFALLGWLALALGVALRRPALLVLVAGRLVPLLLALAYAALLALAARDGPGGGFGSLEEVAALFQNRWLLLAGWAHYLCFDLMVGGWIAAEVLRRGLPRRWLVPALPATFLFGPLGLLVFWAAVGWARARQPR